MPSYYYTLRHSTAFPQFHCYVGTQYVGRFRFLTRAAKKSFKSEGKEKKTKKTKENIPNLLRRHDVVQPACLNSFKITDIYPRRMVNFNKK